MKILKRSLSVFLAVCLTLSCISSLTVFAGGGLNQHNTASANGQSKGGAYDWTFTQWKTGYKVSLIMSPEGPMDTSASLYGGKNIPLTGILTLSDYGDLASSYVTNKSAVWTQATPIYGNLDSPDAMLGDYDSELQIAEISGPARYSNLVLVSDLPHDMNDTGLFNAMKLVVDSAGTIYDAIGISPTNVCQPTLITKFPASGAWQLTDQIFSVYKSAVDTMDSEGIYQMLFNKLTSDMQDSILKASGASDASDVSKYMEYMNPASPNCMVGWACMIEPVYQLVYNGSDCLFVNDAYTHFLGTAMDWGNVMGATQALARKARDTYQNAPNQSAKDDVAEAFGILATTPSDKYIKWGIFSDAHTPIEHDMPTSIYNSTGWFNSPAAAKGGGTYTAAELLDGGAGVGIFKNSPITPPDPPPCCYPSHDHGTPCPCGGAVRCNCPPGCVCDPNNYAEGCDCVPPPPAPPVPDPTIHEDHLTERLEKDMTSTNNPKTFSVVYKDEYSGGTRHYDDGNHKYDNSVTRTITHYSCGTNTDDPTHMAQHHAMGIKCRPLGSHTETETKVWYDNWHVYEDYKYVWNNGLEFTGYIPSSNLTSYSKLVSTMDPFILFHNGDRAQIKWDGHINDTFKETDSSQNPQRGDLYEGTNKITWISHRYAVGPNAHNAIWLSEYMSKYETSKRNQVYKDAMNASGFGGTMETTNGSKITASIKGTEGDFQWDVHVGNGEPIKWATSENAEYGFVSNGTHESGHYNTNDYPASCGGGRPDPVDQKVIRDALATVTLNQANFSTNVHVQAVYPGSAKRQQLYKGDPYVKVSGDGNTWTFSSPSSVFHFYPSYKIKAIYDVNGADTDVWGLSRRLRSFSAEDKLTISFKSNGGTIEAPWSRDHGDAQYTAKAGNAYQYTGNGGTVTFDGYFHLLDPDFAPDPAKQSQANQLIVGTYISQLEDVVNSINGNNVGVYSNLYYASANSVYSPKIPGGFSGRNEGRETIKITNASANGGLGGTSYNFLPGFDGVQTGSRVNGATSGDPLGSNQQLTQNLERGGGIQVQGWYNEDFEGILVVHVTASVDVGQVDTAMTIIEENLSDDLTRVDELAQPISVNVPGVGSFTKCKGTYAIGTEVNIGAVNWGRATANVVGLFDPTIMHVRGSAYDMAD